MSFIFGSWIDGLHGATRGAFAQPQWKESLEEAGFLRTLFLASTGEVVSHLGFVSQRGSIFQSNTPQLSSSVLVSDSSSAVSSEPATPPNESNFGANFPSSRSDDCMAEWLMHDTISSELSKVGLQSLVSLPAMMNPDTPIVQHFSSGGEVGLVHFLSRFDTMKPHVIWLHSNTEANNAALIGLARTIRHEFAMWRIHVALFHPSWDPAIQKAYIYARLLPLRWIDVEVMINEAGNISVPRIVAARPPPQTELRGCNPIQFEGAQIWRAYPPVLGPHDVEIAVAFIGLSPAFPGCSEFSGKVTAVGMNVHDRNLVGER